VAVRWRKLQPRESRSNAYTHATGSSEPSCINRNDLEHGLARWYRKRGCPVLLGHREIQVRCVEAALCENIQTVPPAIPIRDGYGSRSFTAWQDLPVITISVRNDRRVEFKDTTTVRVAVAVGMPVA
jgi:hypothetical protein